MKHFESSAVIDASTDRVWAVLLDGASYPEWGSGVARVDGSIEDGGKITVHSEVAPGRSFPVKVSIDRPDGTMTWTGGMPLGLFRGVRTFRLEPAADGTSFSMREEFSGPLLGMIGKKMPDLQPSFDQFTAALTAEAERRPR